MAERALVEAVASYTCVQVIWAFAGPAIAAGVLRACLDCGGPFETVTGPQDRCIGCRGEGSSTRWLPLFVEPPPPKPPRRKAYKPKRLPVLHLCAVCGDLGLNLACSGSCEAERNRRKARDWYRSRHGLPVDHRMPTAYWAAFHAAA